MIFFILLFFVFFFRGGGVNLCSLDLIVFSLLLPRLSTSTPPPLCQKTQVSGMRVGSQTHRKAGLRRSQSQMTFTRQICLSTVPKSSGEAAQPLDRVGPFLLRSPWIVAKLTKYPVFFLRKMTFQVSVSRCWELPAAAQKMP